MRAGIHPEYVETTITCACGEVIHTRSTLPSLRVEICSKCHPFFTGKQKLVDTAGRVERLHRKYGRKKKEVCPLHLPLSPQLDPWLGQGGVVRAGPPEEPEAIGPARQRRRRMTRASLPERGPSFVFPATAFLPSGAIIP